jgi:alanyl-tRNA synthetase
MKPEAGEAKMTNERAYYRDAYRTAFDARVVERESVGGQPALVLDESYFYPTSGGQPHDTGRINGVRVVDVTMRERDQAVLHLLEGEIATEEVHCEVDWGRRFDHMQQHSGQHILSAAFEQLLDAETIGFHLGLESSTIDLDVREVTPDQLAKVEGLANEVILSDLSIRAEIMTVEEAHRLPLRKPPTVEGSVRIINIEDFDLSACGGTHVQRAGEIGLIKIIKLESRGDEVRIEFLCGRRALVDYREKHALVTRIANRFTTGQTEVEGAIERLLEESRSLRSALRKAREELLAYEADRLHNRAERHGEMTLIMAVFGERDRGDLGRLARNLSERPGVVALLGSGGDKCHLVFARAANVERDMVPLLKGALSVLGSTSGGGRSEIAQGGGAAANEADIAAALEAARQLLLTGR